MKITANKVDEFIARPWQEIKSVLLYGPEAGLVAERANIITRKIVKDSKDPFLITDILPERLKDDEAMLVDEIAAISFASGRRLIRIKGATNQITDAISTALNFYVSGDIDTLPLLLVLADELDASSKLRKLYENHKEAVALPCYKEEGFALERFIESECRERGINIDYEAREYLIQVLPKDRLMVRSELEKLSIYSPGEKITLEAVEKVVGNLTEVGFNEICNAVADGNMKNLVEGLPRLYMEGVTAVAILRVVAGYMIKLYIVAGLLKQGMMIEQAIQEIKPPIFFKQVPSFKRHVMNWSLNSITRAIGFLTETEIESKKTGAKPELLLNHCLLVITSLAGRRA